MTEIEATTLYTKMARIMGSLNNLPKDAENKFHNYKFTAAETVLSTVRQLMARENIAFFAETIHSERHDTCYLVEYRYTFACGDTGATKVCSWQGEAAHTTSNGKVDDKALNKAATTAQKYFLLKTFLIGTGDDLDVDANENVSAQPVERPAPASNGKSSAPSPVDKHVITVDITGGTVKLKQDGSARYIQWDTVTGTDVYAFSRDLWRRRNWPCDKWDEVGMEIEFSLPVAAQIVYNASRGDLPGYYSLMDVGEYILFERKQGLISVSLPQA